MQIKTMINNNNYWPFYGPGYTNHLPMALAALYHLGGSENQIQAFEKHYLDVVDLKIVHSSSNVTALEAALGERESYEAYVDYFKHLIDEEGIEFTVKNALNQMVDGLSSALFHGLIRIAYAMTFKDPIEISRALASLACSYQKIDSKSEIIEGEELKNRMMTFIQQREGLFHLKGDIKEKKDRIIDALLDLYLNTGSFIVLHTITGFEALLSVEKYYDNFNHVLDVFLVSVLRVLLRVSADDYKNIEIKSVDTWDFIIKQVLNLKDAHTIKFAYALRNLETYFQDERLKLAAQVKLKLDHNL